MFSRLLIVNLALTVVFCHGHGGRQTSKGTPAVADDSANNSSVFPMDEGSGKWNKCIGDAMSKCLSCVAAATGGSIDGTVAAATGAGVEASMAAVLAKTGGAPECMESCNQTSASQVATQCKKNTYCQNSNCVSCCGSGNWQCVGNEWSPQCAPKVWAAPSFVRALPIPTESNNKLAAGGPHGARPVFMGVPLVESKTGFFVEPCRCGPGSGNPDTCCSRCTKRSDPHKVGDCTGHGRNSGPFCGNDFHTTGQDACFGDKPLCCTNCCGKPVCCRANQRCHSPHVGDNRCVDI